jgi:hypothetical protein
MTTGRALAIALPTLAWACESPPLATFVVRDSVGVRIVESAAPSWSEEEGWSVAAEPALSIGALDGPEEVSFDAVRSVLRLADGMIVVADWGANQVRFFDATGAFVRAFGASGEGPGEFRLMRSVGVLSDSTWVYDLQLNRLTVIDPSSLGFRVSPLEAQRLGLGAAGTLPDGSMIFASDMTFGSGPEPPPAGMQRGNAAYVHVTPSGETIDTVLIAAGADVFVRFGADFIEAIRPLFGRTASHALRGDRLLYGDQELYEIRVYARDGTLLEILRRSGLDLAVTDSDRAAALDEMLGDVTEDRRPAIRARYADMETPATRPAFTTFLTDPLDHLWVQDFVQGLTATTWSVFSPDGVWLGEVTFPERFQPTQILEDEVLGVWRDELDVEYVRVYALRRE